MDGKGKHMAWARRAALLLLVGAILAGFLFAMDRLDAGRADESAEQLDRSLRRAIAACYAATGAYPQSLDEIVERYGVQVDGERYHVFYMPVAENLPPELDVIELGKEDG